MKILEEVKLDFDDVLIKPKRSTLGSRSEVQLERTFIFPHTNREWTGIPIISANMSSISTIEMYKELSKYKMITCFHKFYEPEDYPLDMDPNYYMISTGIRDGDWEKLQKIIQRLNPYFVCIDVANGYSTKLLDFIKRVRETYPDITLMAGNVVCQNLTEELLINYGVSIVKIGIGSGSGCITRSKTACGFPQLSAIIECSDSAHGLGGMICSDGGIKTPADVCKALGAGADFIMIGGYFSGHDENSELFEENGKKYATFYGMSSTHAMEKHYGGKADYRSSEGRHVKVPYKGKISDTVNDLLGGIRSCCTYIGSNKLKNISKCTTFIRVNRQLNTIYAGKDHSI